MGRGLRGALSVVMTVLAAGCLTAPEPNALTPPGLVSPGPGLIVDGALVTDASGLRWTSDATVGSGSHPHAGLNLVQCLMNQCPEPSTPCTPQNCETREFTLDVPKDWWTLHDGFLEFSIRWPSVFDDWFQIRLEGPDGTPLAVGRAGYMTSFGLSARLDRPSAGAYRAVLVHVSGSSPLEAVLQVESDAPPPGTRDLLPNLVTLPPTDLSFEDPVVEGPGYFTVLPGAVVAPLHRAVGAHGCATEEIAVQGARKCLRFSNAVANLGDGPLEIRLPVEQGVASAAGGHFTQRVYGSDGSHVDRPGGAAEFHPMHAHWHNAAANRYIVYEFDVQNQTRGEPVGDGRKAGVCFADIGLTDLGLPHTMPGRFSGVPCLNPAFTNDWYMGLSPNWYDNYHWALVDQYVELSGVPDGTYTLCSTTNQDGTLLESDYADNEGCAVFEMNAFMIKVLSPEPYHRIPPAAR